jgi:hypothetical protein
VYNNKDVSKTTGCTVTKTYRVQKITYINYDIAKLSLTSPMKGHGAEFKMTEL